MRVLLARHGVSSGNLDRVFQGHMDTTLSPVGEQQAACLAERLATEEISAVYSSDLQRAWRTAEIVTAGRGLLVHLDPAWRELGLGEWEGLTREEVIARFPGIWEQRQRDPLNVPPPGGEGQREVLLRVTTSLQRLVETHRHETILIVTHAAVLGLLSAWAYNLDLASNAVRWRSSNCGLSCLRWDGDAPQVEYWNDVTHLPPELTTIQWT